MQKASDDLVALHREMAACRRCAEAGYYVESALIHPEVLVLVGGLAIQTFLGDNKLEDIVGKVIARVRKALGALRQLKQDLKL